MDEPSARGLRRRVLIYAPHLLPQSQPWLRQHAELLPGYETALAGRRRIRDGLEPGPLASFCIDDHPRAAWQGSLLVLTGRSPGLETFIRRFQPALIHAHFAPGATEVMGIAGRLGVPLVVSCHGWDAHIAGRSLYERCHLARRSRLFRQSALVLAASAMLRTRMLALGADPARTEVHYLGIDRDRFDGRRCDDGRPRIAMVGRLVPSKGTGLALEALRLLLQRVPGATLEIVGDGPDRAGLERIAATRRLPVVFHGARSQADVRDVLARARVFCFPSTAADRLQPEALGLAAAEAQAMGVPVVACATGGIPEVVAEGVGGLLVPDGDAVALAAGLERLLTDGALHSRIAEAGRGFVAERFDLRRNLARLADRYTALLDAPR
ncbi:MAG: glycosyltransferase [Amaricoccus sp.]